MFGQHSILMQTHFDHFDFPRYMFHHRADAKQRKMAQEVATRVDNAVEEEHVHSIFNQAKELANQSLKEISDSEKFRKSSDGNKDVKPLKFEDILLELTSRTFPMMEMERKAAEARHRKMVEEVANRVNNHATNEHIQTRAESPNIHAALQDVANSLIALGASTKILIESAKKTPYTSSYHHVSTTISAPKPDHTKVKSFRYSVHKNSGQGDKLERFYPLQQTRHETSGRGGSNAPTNITPSCHNSYKCCLQWSSVYSRYQSRQCVRSFNRKGGRFLIRMCSRDCALGSCRENVDSKK
ncbi:hypothetical protein ACHAWT_005343 [Skeletonema menzelii]